MAKLRPTSFDYLVMAINPALVIALVGSLVFFLIEVFYEGEFQTRLCFIMGCFTLGTVGITRIAIELDAARASLYGLALSGAMLLVAPRFAEINILLLIVLLTVIWYSAHRLTWDCTLIDEEQDASGEGLLQRIGLDAAPSEANRAVEESVAPKRPFWRRLFAPDKSKHAPGLTVVYFSLAALPIFGILQGFIPSSDVEARRRAFLSLIAYVGAGLGLLLTTSLLGLRRYLRQRQVEMPVDMTAAWLAVGGGLIAIVLVFATVLPRSAREFQLGKSPITFTSAEQIARKGGWGNEGAKGDAKGQGQNEKEQDPKGEPGDQQQGAPKDGKQGKGDAKNGQPQQGQGGDQQKRNGNEPNQNAGDDKKSDSRNDPGKKPGDQQQSDRDPEDQRKPESEEERKEREGKQNEREQNGQKPKQGQPNRNEQQGQLREARQDGGNAPTQQRPPPAPSNFKLNFDPTAAVPFLGWLVKVLVFASIAIVLIYCAIRYRHEFLAAFRQLLTELANFWRSLFGGKRAKSEAQLAAPVEQHRRFSELANPFRRGGSNQNPRELVQTTFAAMEAWARDHGYPREKEQTAFEFAEALSMRVGDLAKESKWLADCYSRAAYSSEDVSNQAVTSLATVWQRMEQLYGRIPPPAPIPPGSA
jgi:hypothetical protein